MTVMMTMTTLTMMAVVAPVCQLKLPVAPTTLDFDPPLLLPTTHFPPTTTRSFFEPLPTLLPTTFAYYPPLLFLHTHFLDPSLVMATTTTDYFYPPTTTRSFFDPPLLLLSTIFLTHHCFCPPKTSIGYPLPSSHYLQLLSHSFLSPHPPCLSKLSYIIKSLDFDPGIAGHCFLMCFILSSNSFRNHPVLGQTPLCGFPASTRGSDPAYKYWLENTNTRDVALATSHVSCVDLHEFS